MAWLQSKQRFVFLPNFIFDRVLTHQILAWFVEAMIQTARNCYSSCFRIDELLSTRFLLLLFLFTLRW